MKKGCLIFFLVLFLFGTIHIFFGEEKRIYNDGVIDYVPLEASFVLDAWDKKSSLKNIQYSVDGAPIKNYYAPISFTTEGRHVIVYRAFDKTGNVSNEKIYSVIVDGTAPEGLVSVEGPVFINDKKIYLTRKSAIILWAEDNLSGVDAIYVKLDDGKFIAYTKPVFISKEGFHKGRAYAVDNVGNKTATYVMSGYVDNTPPEVEIVTKKAFVTSSNENYTNKDNVYSCTSYDSISGIKEILISLDDSKYVPYTAPFKIQIPGFHTLKAKARDNLGNESYPVEIEFYVDVVPPDTTLGTSIEE